MKKMPHESWQCRARAWTTRRNGHTDTWYCDLARGHVGTHKALRWDGKSWFHRQWVGSTTGDTFLGNHHAA